jgi:hypothetical protein
MHRDLTRRRFSNLALATASVHSARYAQNVKIIPVARSSRAIDDNVYIVTCGPPLDGRFSARPSDLLRVHLKVSVFMSDPVSLAMCCPRSHATKLTRLLSGSRMMCQSSPGQPHITGPV